MPAHVSAQKWLYTGKATTSDVGSVFQYNSIEYSNKEARNNMLKTFGYVNSMEALLDVEHKETTAFTNSMLLLKRTDHIGRFVKKSSHDFIKVKYPLLKPRNSDEFLKNSLIQLRFKRKFDKEGQNVKNYLSSNIAIAEGERLYLVLSSIENVIKIAIENEKY